MSSPWRPSCRYAKPVFASIAFSGLVLFATVSQADTPVAVEDEAPSAVDAFAIEVSFWVDAAPLSLVITQLAHLSGKSAEIEGLTEMPVSGRFSASLGTTLAKLSTDYPVIFDLSGETLRATNRDAQSSVSIAMPGADLNETFKQELLASAGSGNKVEFREDAVRVSGHPAFVKRQAKYITETLAKAEARGNIETLAEDTEVAPTDVTSIADSGSAEVLVDIQDESNPPAEQANLSKPIRWVTDIPGFNTF